MYPPEEAAAKANQSTVWFLSLYTCRFIPALQTLFDFTVARRLDIELAARFQGRTRSSQPKGYFVCAEASP